MCQPIWGPQYTSVSFLIKPLKYITNLDPNINLPSWTLPGRLPVLRPVCSLYFFCILMKPCDRALPVLPSTDKTIGLYALYLLDGNALYLHFFLFFGELSKDSLYIEMENRLVRGRITFIPLFFHVLSVVVKIGGNIKAAILFTPHLHRGWFSFLGLFGVFLIFAECFICCLLQLERTYWMKYSPIVEPWSVCIIAVICYT